MQFVAYSANCHPTGGRSQAFGGQHARLPGSLSRQLPQPDRRTRWLGTVGRIVDQPGFDRNVIVIVAAVALFTATPMRCMGQPEVEDGSPPENAAYLLDSVKPSIDDVAKIEFDRGGSTRVLGVTRGVADTRTPLPEHVKLYFVRPEFGIQTRRQPTGDRRSPGNGLGNLVHDVRWRGTEIELLFRFRLCSAHTIRAARFAIARSPFEADYLRSEADSIDRRLKVVIEPYPVARVIFVCRSAVTGATLAMRAVNVNDTHGLVDVWMTFDPAALEEFIASQSSDRNGDLEFVPIYLFRGQHMKAATQTTEITAEQILKARQVAKSQQAKGTPILQGVVNKFARELNGRIYEKVEASDDSMLHVVDLSATFLIGTVFEPGRLMSFSKLRQAFPDYSEQMLAAYLEPQVEAINATRGSQNTEGRRDGNSEEVELRLAASAGLKLGGPASVVGFSAGGQAARTKVQQAIKTLESTSGVQFTWDESSRSFKPHRIRVYNVADGKVKQHLRRYRNVQVGAGLNDHYLIPSSIKDWFTTDFVDARVQTVIDQGLEHRRKLEREIRLGHADLNPGKRRLELEQQLSKAKNELNSYDAQQSKERITLEQDYFGRVTQKTVALAAFLRDWELKRQEQSQLIEQLSGQLRTMDERSAQTSRVGQMAKFEKKKWLVELMTADSEENQ